MGEDGTGHRLPSDCPAGSTSVSTTNDFRDSIWRKGHAPGGKRPPTPSDAAYSPSAQPHGWPPWPGLALPAHHAHAADGVLQRGRSNPETLQLNLSVVSPLPSAMVSKLCLKIRSGTPEWPSA